MQYGICNITGQNIALREKVRFKSCSREATGDVVREAGARLGLTGHYVTKLG